MQFVAHEKDGYKLEHIQLDTALAKTDAPRGNRMGALAIADTLKLKICSTFRRAPNASFPRTPRSAKRTSSRPRMNCAIWTSTPSKPPIVPSANRKRNSSAARRWTASLSTRSQKWMRSAATRRTQINTRYAVIVSVTADAKAVTSQRIYGAKHEAARVNYRRSKSERYGSVMRMVSPSSQPNQTCAETKWNHRQRRSSKQCRTSTRCGSRSPQRRRCRGSIIAARACTTSKTMTAAQRGTRRCGTISTAPARAECHAIGQQNRRRSEISRIRRAIKITANVHIDVAYIKIECNEAGAGKHKTLNGSESMAQALKLKNASDVSAGPKCATAVYCTQREQTHDARVNFEAQTAQSRQRRVRNETDVAQMDAKNAQLVTTHRWTQQRHNDADYGVAKARRITRDATIRVRTK